MTNTNFSGRGALIFIGLAIAILSVTGCESDTMNKIRLSQHLTTQYTKYPISKADAYRHPYLPIAAIDDVNRWKGIVIHHSATVTGDARTFDALHRTANGWDSLGYHFVINNGKNDYGLADGTIEIGGRWKEQKHGAHCRPAGCEDNYWNEHTIGICLVGNFEKHKPSDAQYRSLAELVTLLRRHYQIDAKKIIGHKDADNASTLCPGRHFSWYNFGQQLRKLY